MRVHVYSAANGYYLHVPVKDDFAVIPGEIFAQLGGQRGVRYIKDYIVEDRPLIGVDYDQLQDDIRSCGYHINRIKIEFHESRGEV